MGIAPYIYQNAKINEQPFVIAATNFDGLKKNSPFWLVDGDWPSEKGQLCLVMKFQKNWPKNRRSFCTEHSKRKFTRNERQ